MYLDPKLDVKALSWVKRGERRIKVLQYMASVTYPVTCKDVKKALKLDIRKAAYAIKGMREQKLLECLNLEQKNGKLYVITEKGKYIAERLNP